MKSPKKKKTIALNFIILKFLPQNRNLIKKIHVNEIRRNLRNNKKKKYVSASKKRLEYQLKKSYDTNDGIITRITHMIIVKTRYNFGSF